MSWCSPPATASTTGPPKTPWPRGPATYRGIALLPTDVDDAELQLAATPRAFAACASTSWATWGVHTPIDDVLVVVGPLWHPWAGICRSTATPALLTDLAPALPWALDARGNRPHRPGRRLSLGIDQPDFQALMKLMTDRALLGQGERDGADLAAGPPDEDALPFARTLVEEFGDRAVWGNDWPHPNHGGRSPTRALVDLRRNRADRGGTTSPAGRQSAPPLSIWRQHMNRRFNNKVAIVTGAGCVGAGWGNGRANAVLFPAEAPGLGGGPRPAPAGRDVERAGEVARIPITLVCDVTSSESVAAMAAPASTLRPHRRPGQQCRRLGRGRAGRAGRGGLGRADRLNLKSVFLTCKHVLR